MAETVNLHEGIPGEALAQNIGAIVFSPQRHEVGGVEDLTLGGKKGNYADLFGGGYYTANYPTPTHVHDIVMD